MSNRNWATSFFSYFLVITLVVILWIFVLPQTSVEAGTPPVPTIPTISYFVQSSASAFNMVAIWGSNFTSVTEVQFGGVPAESFSIINNGLINAIVAPDSASGDVTVISPEGTSNLSGFTYVTPNSNICTSVTPSITNAVVGTQFSVDLDITTNSGFVGWGAQVNFDASKLECTSVTSGMWLNNYVTSNGGFVYVGVPSIDNTNGIVGNLGYAGINLNKSATGLTGTGTLVTLTFDVKAGALGTTTIQPVDFILSSATAHETDNAMIDAGDINISSAGIPTINTTILPNAIGGTPYSQTLSATGGTGNYTWTVVSGTLPDNFNLSGDGVIGGQTAHTYAVPSPQYNFTVQASDGANNSTTQTLTISLDRPVWDVNDDGIADIQDVVMIGLHWQAFLGNPNYDVNCDLNGDGIINVSDLLAFSLHWNQTW